jgi:hypothetical protein
MQLTEGTSDRQAQLGTGSQARVARNGTVNPDMSAC